MSARRRAARALGLLALTLGGGCGARTGLYGEAPPGFPPEVDAGEAGADAVNVSDAVDAADAVDASDAADAGCVWRAGEVVALTARPGERALARVQPGGDGGAWVSWNELNDPSREYLWIAQAVSLSGQALGPERVVAERTPGASSGPLSMWAVGSGAAALSWDNRSFCRMFPLTADLQRAGDPVLLGMDFCGDLRGWSGGFNVRQERPGGANDTDVKLVSYAPDGAMLGTAVAAPRRDHAPGFARVVYPDGATLVAWLVGYPSPMSMRVRAFDGRSNPTSEARTAATFDTAGRGLGAMPVGGGVMLLYLVDDAADAQVRRLRAQLVGPDGAPRVPEFEVTEAGAMAPGAKFTATSDGERGMLVWSNAAGELSAQIRGPDGSAAGAPFALTPVATDARYGVVMRGNRAALVFERTTAEQGQQIAVQPIGCE